MRGDSVNPNLLELWNHHKGSGTNHRCVSTGVVVKIQSPNAVSRTLGYSIIFSPFRQFSFISHPRRGSHMLKSINSNPYLSFSHSRVSGFVVSHQTASSYSSSCSDGNAT